MKTFFVSGSIACCCWYTVDDGELSTVKLGSDKYDASVFGSDDN